MQHIPQKSYSGNGPLSSAQNNRLPCSIRRRDLKRHQTCNGPGRTRTPSCHTHFLACDPIIQSDMETIRHTQKSSLNNWGFVHLTYQYALNTLEIPTSPIAYSMAHRRQSEIIWKKDASERRNEWAQQPVETWSPGWCHQVLFLLNKPACIIRIYHHISDWWFQPYYIYIIHYNTTFHSRSLCFSLRPAGG